MPLQLVKDVSAKERTSLICMLCSRSEDNELLYGKFYTNESVTAHYYCLLFSSGLEQKGKDEEGVLGFLKQDIMKEVRRGSKLHCSKCRHVGATVGCCNKQCKKSYHFPCGAESSMLNQYFGAFNSFCLKHQPVQNVSIKTVAQSKATCTICHEEVMAHPSFDVLWAPCCKKQSWFHRICMQKLALSAGYFFKCPICSNNNLFCNEMKKCGVYIPEQDASWELEPNAFHELIERHNKCDHAVCICPKGRQHDGEATRWELLLCSSCGSKGIHIGCGRLDWSTTEWDCEDCSLSGSRLKSASRNGETISPATSSTVSSSIEDQRSGIKRPRPLDFSEDESSDESEVDIICDVSDPEFSSSSLNSPTINQTPKIIQPSRNVARRGRGPWSSRVEARQRQLSCNFDKLRFKVTEDEKQIIVIIDSDQAKPKSYTIPVDQPISPRQRRIRASNV